MFCGSGAVPLKKALLRITPVSGPAEAAGTAVTFYGRGFVNTTALACQFALAPPVPATFVSPNELFCESPPLFSAADEDHTDGGGAGGLRWSSLSEISQRESDPLTGSRQLFPGAHYHPLFSQRAVGVEVRRMLTLFQFYPSCMLVGVEVDYYPRFVLLPTPDVWQVVPHLVGTVDNARGFETIHFPLSASVLGRRGWGILNRAEPLL